MHYGGISITGTVGRHPKPYEMHCRKSKLLTMIIFYGLFTLDQKIAFTKKLSGRSFKGRPRRTYLTDERVCINRVDIAKVCVRIVASRWLWARPVMARLREVYECYDD